MSKSMSYQGHKTLFEPVGVNINTSQGRRHGGGVLKGLQPPPPPIFDRWVNPISTRGGWLCPPQYYQLPQIFRPCVGPASATVPACCIGTGSWISLRLERDCLLILIWISLGGRWWLFRLSIQVRFREWLCQRGRSIIWAWWCESCHWFNFPGVFERFHGRLPYRID